MRRREALEGYLYILPFLLGFVIFTAYPLLSSLYLSFTQYNVITDPKWIGLENYREAFFTDRLFWDSLRKTAYFALLIVPLGVVGSLAAAMLLNQGYAGTTVFRTLFFLPSITPIIAAALLWQWIMHPTVGGLNYLLRQIGLPEPAWLQSTIWAIPSLVIIAMWGGVGGSRMIVFLAGLQSVPRELYEAAEIDGANNWQRFRRITLPMISPTMFFNVIISIIGALQVFSLSYIATGGGPSYATYFYVFHLFKNAFEFNRMGYASAMAWVFLIIVLALTYVQFRLSNSWVFYAGGEGGGAEEKSDGR